MSVLGELVYLCMLSPKVIVVNSKEVVKDLLERRSTIYSDRPQVMYVGNDLWVAFPILFSKGSLSVDISIGWSFNTVVATYGGKWRLHRRLLHRVLRPDVAINYRPVQLRKARELVPAGTSA